MLFALFMHKLQYAQLKSMRYSADYAIMQSDRTAPLYWYYDQPE